MEESPCTKLQSLGQLLVECNVRYYPCNPICFYSLFAPHEAHSALILKKYPFEGYWQRRHYR